MTNVELLRGSAAFLHHLIVTTNPRVQPISAHAVIDEWFDETELLLAVLFPDNTRARDALDIRKAPR